MATPCTRRAAFFALVRVYPQPLGPDGAYGMEREPAGRSLSVCPQHLARTVRELYALPIRFTDVAVKVSPAYGIGTCGAVTG